MERRKLGALEVSSIGLGCATMTPFYGEPDPVSAIETIRCAAELGIDLLDTSDAYGNGRNVELIARAIAGRRRQYVIASKFGNLRQLDGTPTADGRPEYVKVACEAQSRSARDRCYRSLLYSPGRSDGADRRDRRRNE
jgi:aryl-alcohol dehydrogenase-like predicted oxidoreductase